MKRARKPAVTLLLLALLTALLALPAQAAKKTTVTNAKKTSLKNVTQAKQYTGEWVKKKAGYLFRTESGKTIKSKWINVEDKIYYINSKGYRAKGWVKYRGSLYYLDKTGELHIGWLAVSKKKYYAGANGKIALGKTTIEDATYFFDKKNGAMKTGWVTIGKSKYYFAKSTGQMKVSDWVKVGKKYYYVNEKGKKLTSRWLTLEDKKYYLNSSGARVTGTQYIGGKGYYFDKNGVYDPTVKVKMEVDPTKKMVALTFDDGPGPYTNRLLNCLEKNNAKATFFMVGSSVSSYSGVVKRMKNLGCELGNHSYSHPAFTTLSYSAMRSQVTKTNQAIKKAAGKNPTVFRLPYGDGASNSTVLSALGLPSIYWSIDTRDWANTGNAQHTVNEVLNNVRNGDIVLMHDIHQNSVKAAETIIPTLKKRGYQMVTVSQLAKYKGKKTLKKGTTYYNFR